MKSAVITFPGSNCDRDMDVALKKFGFSNKMVWHQDVELPKSDLVVLPGGFLMEIILDVEVWPLNQKLCNQLSILQILVEW